MVWRMGFRAVDTEVARKFLLARGYEEQPDGTFTHVSGGAVFSIVPDPQGGVRVIAVQLPLKPSADAIEEAVIAVGVSRFHHP
jgi:hypothetical protein